jgi:drug/metabolite transporter (DMT)-like permease
MLLKYQTSVATLIQFITLSFLGFANGVNSVVTTCRSETGDCMSNLLVSIIFFILTAVWFGLVWLLGWAAQNRRSKRLAQLLIIAEVFIAMIAYFNAKNHPDKLSLITSVVDLLLAIWIIILAFRLMRAGPGRVVTKARSRRRPTKRQ